MGHGLKCIKQAPLNPEMSKKTQSDHKAGRYSRWHVFVSMCIFQMFLHNCSCNYGYRCASFLFAPFCICNRFAHLHACLVSFQHLFVVVCISFWLHFDQLVSPSCVLCLHACLCLVFYGHYAALGFMSHFLLICISCCCFCFFRGNQG